MAITGRVQRETQVYKVILVEWIQVVIIFFFNLVIDLRVGFCLWLIIFVMEGKRSILLSILRPMSPTVVFLGVTWYLC